MHTGFKALVPIAVTEVIRRCGSPAERSAVGILSVMLSSGVIARAKCWVVHCAILNTRPQLDLPRVSPLGRHAVRPVFSSK
jgi:hypothetical protein